MSDKHSASLLYDLTQTILRHDPILRQKICELIISHLILVGEIKTAEELKKQS